MLLSPAAQAKERPKQGSLFPSWSCEPALGDHYLQGTLPWAQSPPTSVFTTFTAASASPGSNWKGKFSDPTPDLRIRDSEGETQPSWAYPGLQVIPMQAGV